jgi:hypothetical protein
MKHMTVSEYFQKNYKQMARRNIPCLKFKNGIVALEIRECEKGYILDGKDTITVLSGKESIKAIVGEWIGSKGWKDEPIFQQYDLVKLTSAQYPDRKAVVLGTYQDFFGGGDIDNYQLYIDNVGKVSWFTENEMRLLEHDRKDLIVKWRNKYNPCLKLR